MNDTTTIRRVRRWMLRLTALAAVALMMGCAGKAPRMYLLTPGLDIEPLTGGAPAAMVAGPIVLPDYLDRSQMIIREDGNRLMLMNAHRWAEPLAANINRVVTENLKKALPDCDVRSYPDRPANGDAIRVTLTIQQFEGLGDGVAVLKASWRMSGQTSRAGQASYEAPFNPRRPASLAEAMSELLEMLSRDIARAASGLPVQ